MFPCIEWMLIGRLILLFGAKLNWSHGPFGAIANACNAMKGKATSEASILGNSQAQHGGLSIPLVPHGTASRINHHMDSRVQIQAYNKQNFSALTSFLLFSVRRLIRTQYPGWTGRPVAGVSETFVSCCALAYVALEASFYADALIIRIPPLRTTRPVSNLLH